MLSKNKQNQVGSLTHYRTLTFVSKTGSLVVDNFREIKMTCNKYQTLDNLKEKVVFPLQVAIFSFKIFNF
jgi:glutathione synthase/RimK-type ligase-like ATP-grasp enzyme